MLLVFTNNFYCFSIDGKEEDDIHVIEIVEKLFLATSADLKETINHFQIQHNSLNQNSKETQMQLIKNFELEKEASSKNIRDAVNEIKKLKNEVDIKTKECNEQQSLISELNIHYEKLKVDSSEASSQVIAYHFTLNSTKRYVHFK